MLETSATVRSRPGFIGEKVRGKRALRSKATAECKESAGAILPWPSLAYPKVSITVG
jgi:hypothetical protein